MSVDKTLFDLNCVQYRAQQQRQLLKEFLLLLARLPKKQRFLCQEIVRHILVHKIYDDHFAASNQIDI